MDLDEGVLTINLGIPIVICLHKIDLLEHCGDIEVIGATSGGEVGQVWQLTELLPDAFLSRNRETGE